jgi:hypothetical protein
MRTLGGICRRVSSLPLYLLHRRRFGANYRAALREDGARVNQRGSAAAFHMEAADGCVSLLVRDGRLNLRSDLPNEDAVRLVMSAIDFAPMPAPAAAIFRVTADGQTSEVRRVDGHLVHSGELPTSLPARIFMASIAQAIEERFSALMCGAIALDGHLVRAKELPAASA